MRRTLLLTIAVLALAGVTVGGAVATAAGAAAIAKPIDVRAVRDGKVIRITWRTSRPADHTSFAVAALPLSTAPRNYVRLDGDGRTRFSVRMRPTGPRTKQIAVYATDDDTDAGVHVTVRVR